MAIGDFWYEPEIWEQLPLPLPARLLYAGLCSFLGHGEINRQDLRNTLKDCSDGEIAEALKEFGAPQPPPPGADLQREPRKLRSPLGSGVRELVEPACLGREPGATK